jgi:hypothetical protein
LLAAFGKFGGLFLSFLALSENLKGLIFLLAAFGKFGGLFLSFLALSENLKGLIFRF